MTPTEIREAVARLVEAGKRFGDGSLFIDNAPHMDTILAARVGEREIRVQQRRPFGDVRQDNGLAHFIMYAANARPALSALAGCCVLDVETVETLARYARGAIQAGPEALATLEPRERAMATQALDVLGSALAAAEAELAAVERR